MVRARLGKPARAQSARDMSTITDTPFALITNRDNNTGSLQATAGEDSKVFWLYLQAKCEEIKKAYARLPKGEQMRGEITCSRF